MEKSALNKGGTIPGAEASDQIRRKWTEHRHFVSSCLRMPRDLLPQALSAAMTSPLPHHLSPSPPPPWWAIPSNCEPKQTFLSLIPADAPLCWHCFCWVFCYTNRESKTGCISPEHLGRTRLSWFYLFNPPPYTHIHISFQNAVFMDSCWCLRKKKTN